MSLLHPLAPVPYQGRDSVREFFVSSIDLFPEQHLHVDALLAEADVVALEGRITAMEEGEPTVTPCAYFFTLRDGLVHQIRMYYDTATLEEGE